MAILSDYLEGKVIDHIFRTGTFSKPANLYFALFTSAPSDAGGGTEVTGGSYARVAVTPLDASFAAYGSNGTTNSVAITFPAPSASWGTITHWAVFDASSAGNLLLWGALTNSKVVGATDPAPSWPIGAFVITVAWGSDYLETQFVNLLFRTSGYSKPSGLYFALMTTMPNDLNVGGVEVSGGSYARVGVTPLDANFAAPSSGNGITSNVGVITFPTPTANWGTVVGVAVFDASSSGNLIGYAAFSGARNINNGDAAPTISAGAFTWTIA